MTPRWYAISLHRSWRPAFDPRYYNVGFVLNRVSLERVPVPILLPPAAPHASSIRRCIAPMVPASLNNQLKKNKLESSRH
jgi:hypothetical protein